jgi:hypothetical protein
VSDIRRTSHHHAGLQQRQRQLPICPPPFYQHCRPSLPLPGVEAGRLHPRIILESTSQTSSMMDRRPSRLHIQIAFSSNSSPLPAPAHHWCFFLCSCASPLSRMLSCRVTPCNSAIDKSPSITNAWIDRGFYLTFEFSACALAIIWSITKGWYCGAIVLKQMTNDSVITLFQFSNATKIQWISIQSKHCHWSYVDQQARQSMHSPGKNKLSKMHKNKGRYPQRWLS